MPKTSPKRRTQTESNGEICLCPRSSELEISKGFLCGMLHCLQFLAFKRQGHQSIGRDSKKDNKSLLRLPYRLGPTARENSAVESALAEEAATLGCWDPSVSSRGQGLRPLFTAWLALRWLVHVRRRARAARAQSSEPCWGVSSGFNCRSAVESSNNYKMRTSQDLDHDLD